MPSLFRFRQLDKKAAQHLITTFVYSPMPVSFDLRIVVDIFPLYSQPRPSLCHISEFYLGYPDPDFARHPFCSNRNKSASSYPRFVHRNWAPLSLCHSTVFQFLKIISIQKSSSDPVALSAPVKVPVPVWVVPAMS